MHSNLIQCSAATESSAFKTLLMGSAVTGLTMMQTKVLSAEEVRVDGGDDKKAAEEVVDLSISEPRVTDVCFLDVQIGSDPSVHRIEISLYGEIVPKTVENFKALCTGERGWGYKGSEFYRIISTFSVQGGNIGNPSNAASSELGKFGKSALDDTGTAFPAENYRILHNYPDAGVVSMARDIRNQNFQDSRFFITTGPNASWADGKYVAFGRVTSGMNIVQGMQLIEVKPPFNYPTQHIRIVDSGVLSK